ncbi:hypothetical protein ACHAXR_006288 [Thalassiosira sp. AJA248-18]
MSDPLLLWETLHRGHGQSWLSPVSEADHIIDSQRRFQAMLADGDDIFYSRTDLRMFIDKCRTEALQLILVAFSETHNTDAEAPQELVLHAAAKIRVSPLNTKQLIKDYPNFVRQTYPEDDPNGSTPLHYSAAAVGSNQIDRLKPFLKAYPDAAKQVDEWGLVPMQIALIHGADFDVMKLLVDAYPPAIEYPLLPRPPVSGELEPLVGLLPFHIACCRNYSLDVIFQLLLESPDSISGAGCLWRNHLKS